MQIVLKNKTHHAPSGIIITTLWNNFILAPEKASSVITSLELKTSIFTQIYKEIRVEFKKFIFTCVVGQDW
jgi:hypothetical protein